MTSEKQVNVFALVMAAGSGTRVGGEIPKQYRLIAGESILSRAIKPLLEHPKISAVTVVISELDESTGIRRFANLVSTPSDIVLQEDNK